MTPRPMSSTSEYCVIEHDNVERVSPAPSSQSANPRRGTTIRSPPAGHARAHCVSFRRRTRRRATRRQLAAQDWRGAIVGPHGSGKSTLLESLKPALAAAGLPCHAIALHDGQRRLPAIVFGLHATVASQTLARHHRRLRATRLARTAATCSPLPSRRRRTARHVTRANAHSDAHSPRADRELVAAARRRFVRRSVHVDHARRRRR